MIRSFLFGAAMLVGFSCLPGCGGGGTEATFTQSAAQSEDEVQAAADYEAELKRMERETYGTN